jgi:hypothetical protein
MKRKFLRIPLLIGIAVFSLSMVLLWATHVGEINQKIALVGVIYASVCFLFLLFQIAAFVRSHLYYDEDVEAIKMKVFDVEK